MGRLNHKSNQLIWLFISCRLLASIPLLRIFLVGWWFILPSLGVCHQLRLLRGKSAIIRFVFGVSILFSTEWMKLLSMPRCILSPSHCTAFHSVHDMPALRSLNLYKRSWKVNCELSTNVGFYFVVRITSLRSHHRLPYITVKFVNCFIMVIERLLFPSRSLTFFYAHCWTIKYGVADTSESSFVVLECFILSRLSSFGSCAKT